MQDKKSFRYSEITELILGCCFDVMNELGSGFLESVYKNALVIAMEEKGLTVLAEQRFEVIFRGRKIGSYIADLIVEKIVIIELKCCEQLQPEHQAQLINYLSVTGIEACRYPQMLNHYFKDPLDLIDVQFQHLDTSLAA